MEEANAIGIAYLRSQLLPASVRSDVQKLWREYLGLRIQASAIIVCPNKKNRFRSRAIQLIANLEEK